MEPDEHNSNRKMKTKTLFYLLFVLFISQSFNTLTISFVRTVENNNKKEISKGYIYYYDNKTITLKITAPILQWMVISGNKTLIYYPEENKALNIKSQAPAVLPFFQAFIAIIKSDFGLSEIGFKLRKNEFKEDTLYTYWESPENLKNAKISYILMIYNDRIIGIKVIKQIEEILAELRFKDHYPYGGLYFHLKMDITQYQSKKITVYENIIYSNPIFDHPLPEEVVHFQIPENIETKEIEW
jgi:hypothetical protein